MRGLAALALVGGILFISACKTSDAAHGVASAGQQAVDGVSSTASSLVNVNLSNVLNDLAVKLHVDQANIPVNAQIPITIAANICGVSINVLSVSQGGTSQGCTAVTTSPQLTQVVGQQLQAGGGTQTGSAPPAASAPPSSPAAATPTAPAQ